MHMDATGKQALDGLNCMGTTSNHDCLAHFAQAAAQVEVILQTMQRNHAVEMPSREISGETVWGASRRQQQRLIAKATITGQRDIFSPRMNLFYVGRHNMDTLLPLGSCRI